MNFLNIVKAALNVIGDVTGISILKDASGAIETIPAEKQAEIELALMKHQEEMKSLGIEEIKAVISESLAMINSPDKFTSRARPFGVYAASIVTVALAVGMIFGIQLDTGGVVSLLTPLWGNAAFYTYNRTKEKTTNGNA